MLILQNARARARAHIHDTKDMTHHLLCHTKLDNPTARTITKHSDWDSK